MKTIIATLWSLLLAGPVGCSGGGGAKPAAAPAPPRRAAKFTDIVGGGHTIWDLIYDLSGGNGDIYAWMLTNAKP